MRKSNFYNHINKSKTMLFSPKKYDALFISSS